MSRFAVGALLLVGSASIALSQDDPKKVVESLQGEWKLVSFSKAGEDVPKSELEGSKIVVTEEKMAITFGKREEEATFTVDPKAKPPAIDIKPTKKKDTVKGIYKLEKDTLTICFGPDEAARPTEFKASKDASMMVLERVKK